MTAETGYSFQAGRQATTSPRSARSCLALSSRPKGDPQLAEVGSHARSAVWSQGASCASLGQKLPLADFWGISGCRVLLGIRCLWRFQGRT